MTNLKEYISREDNHFNLYATYPGVKAVTTHIRKATDALVKDKRESGFWDKGLARKVGKALIAGRRFGATDTASREAWYIYIEKRLGLNIPYEEEIFTLCINQARG